MSRSLLLSRRTRAVRLLLVLAFAALVVRLIAVQELSHQHYASLSTAELTQTVQVPAVRGGIYDRSGNVLAESVIKQTVVADPLIIKHPAGTARALGPVLGIPVTSLEGALAVHSGFVYLAHRVPSAVAAKVTALHLTGINLVPESQRIEPNGQLASPVVGTVNWAGNGASGLEYQYQRLLAGHAGSQQLMTSPNGIPLPGTSASAAAKPGTGIELTLDESIQYVTEQALAAEISASHATSGTAVIMDVKTGDILAMADLQAAKPGTPSTSDVTASSAGPTLVSSADTLPAGIEEASSNTAVTKVFEPGSVFKVNTFSAALAAGVVTPNQVLNVPPDLPLGGYVFQDAEPHGSEQLTASQIIAQSSNIGTIEITQRLGESRLLAQIANLGFGRPTGLHFPGASPGIVPGPSSWTASSIGSTPIGQDDAVTALQVLDAYNAVANGGVFVKPRLVQATVSPSGGVTPLPPSPTRRVIPRAVNAQLVRMLEGVVTSGTGTRAAITGYTVAGKTGSSQIPSTHHLGYTPGAFIGSFVGFAPAEAPVLSAMVVLDHPVQDYGGAVAAPVFSTIMAYALHHFGISTSVHALAPARLLPAA
ncbi:MAG: peptidoglycan D,D-transpeptidase FtsI family protein [Acidimicrobiales bacterium]